MQWTRLTGVMFALFLCGTALGQESPASSEAAEATGVDALSVETMELVDALDLRDLLDQLNEYRSIDEQGQKYLRLEAQLNSEVERSQRAIEVYSNKPLVKQLLDLRQNPQAAERVQQILAEPDREQAKRHFNELLRGQGLLDRPKEFQKALGLMQTILRHRDAMTDNQKSLALVRAKREAHLKSPNADRIDVPLPGIAAGDPRERAAALRKAIAGGEDELEVTVEPEAAAGEEIDLLTLFEEVFRDSAARGN